MGKGVRERVRTVPADQRSAAPARRLDVLRNASERKTQNQLAFFTQQSGMCGRLTGCLGCSRATFEGGLVLWGRTVDRRQLTRPAVLNLASYLVLPSYLLVGSSTCIDLE